MHSILTETPHGLRCTVDSGVYNKLLALRVKLTERALFVSSCFTFVSTFWAITNVIFIGSSEPKQRAA